MLPVDVSAWMDHVHRRAVPASQAYALAAAVARQTKAPDVAGYRIFWMHQHGAWGCIDAPAERSRPVVVGRHDRCDVVLHDERAVSLRHVLLRVSALDDGFPIVNVLDLETSDGFELSDGSRQRCVVASGPLVFRVGVHSIVAIPNGVKLAEELPDPIVDRAESDPYKVKAERVALAPAVAMPHRPTRITVIPASVQISETARGSSERPPAGASHADRYEVLLEARGQRAAVRLSAKDVEHGVLIGRADKCVDAGLRAVLSDDVSRVHALVIRENDGVFLYDTGSTHGTYVGDRRVRCVGLADEGTEVRLAVRGGVTMRWRGLAD
jgi:hypothetical protein